MFWIIIALSFVVFLVVMKFIDLNRVRTNKRFEKIDKNYEGSVLSDEVHINIMTSVENTIAKIVHLSESTKFEFNTASLCFCVNYVKPINKERLREKVGKKYFKKFNFENENYIRYNVTNGPWVKAEITIWLYDMSINDEQNSYVGFGTEMMHKALKPSLSYEDQEYAAASKYCPLAKEIWYNFSKKN